MMRRGFTLVEVMISVVLVLFLIIGVNKVFQMTTDTVGAGQVMSENVRDSRAAQSVLHADVAAAVQAPPMFIIASSRVSAFRNANDRATDRDFGNATTIAEREEAIRTIDLNGDNAENVPATAGELISPAIYNYRSHRIDRLAFFARDIFQRQTANDGAFASLTTSGEAWIWYGHLRMENSDGVYFQPGQFDANTADRNTNNALASDFALGRMVMLLRDRSSMTTTEDAVQRDPRLPPRTNPGDPPPPPPGPNPKLTPLSWESVSPPGGSAVNNGVWTSRYDLAETTIAQFSDDLDLVAGPGQTWWWQRFLFARSTAEGDISTFPVGLNAPPVDYRFRGNRYFTKPLDSRKAAELAPILLNGAGQFIVEFAGDYITQNATTGAKTSNLPDTITDFVIDDTIGADVRSIRWYGMPRDVAGGTAGGPDGHILTTGNQIDVLPVRDVRGAAADFERRIGDELPAPAGNDYAQDMLPNARYTCVWGPDVILGNDPLPQMLRITIVIEDENGRLAEGQQYEYVIDLPY